MMENNNVKEYFARLKSVGLLPNTEQCNEILKSHGLGELLNGN